jgi:minor extracellular serine protease Vpr
LTAASTTNHPNFGGSGVATDYAEDDRTVIEPGTFPTAKVAGGFDFVGDAYDPQSDDPARNTPNPDPDPLDCDGHGSHVAGSVAGSGVRIDRSTYTGPYDATTLNSGFLVGPGVAPEATLYALKIFGCQGTAGTSTDLIVEALDWAVAHDLDVVNLSLGAAFGRPDDADAIAATNAALAGVVVVASAGNTGAGPYVLNTPAAGKGALAVAALDTNQGIPFVKFTTASGSIRMINTNSSAAIPLSAAVRLLTDEPSTPANESLGCSFDDYATVQPGEIVVTRRGTCADTDRVTLASQANASAVVLIHQRPGFFPPLVGNQGGAIPLLGANPEDEATIISAAGSTASVEDDGVINPGCACIPNFSSSGPRNGDSGLKPDVTAPGVGIYSTGLGTGYGAARNSGTSMSTAFISGIAALVRDARPNWRATQVKAAIINNAVPLGDQRRSTSMGSGVALPRLAVGAEVVAMGESTGGGLSFGFVESTGPVAQTETITIINRSNSAATYTLRPEWFTDIAQATMTFSRDTVTVPARGRATVDVTLRVDARGVPGGDNPGVLARQPGMVAGNVVLTTGQEGELLGLRVPFSNVVRGNSTISSTPRSTRVADEITFTSTNSAGVLGPIDVFAWGLSDPRGDALGTDVRNVGFQSRPDLDLGIFAIHSANTESNPSVNEWNVMLNTDGDEEPDYAIVGRDSGTVLLGGLTGNNLVAVTVDLETGQTVRAFEFAFTQLNSGMVLLPFQLADVGLAAGAGGVLLHRGSCLAGGGPRRGPGGWHRPVQRVQTAGADRPVQRGLPRRSRGMDRHGRSCAVGGDPSQGLAGRVSVQPGRERPGAINRTQLSRRAAPPAGAAARGCGASQAG